MVATTKIGNFNATWVLRHRWEKGSKSMLDNQMANRIRTELRLGIWFKKKLVLGTIKRKENNKVEVKETFSTDNLVNKYMIGLDLIVCMCWVDFSFKPTFGIDLKNK